MSRSQTTDENFWNESIKENSVNFQWWPNWKTCPNSTKNHLIVWFAEHTRNFLSSRVHAKVSPQTTLQKAIKEMLESFLRSHSRVRRRKTLTLVVGRRKLNLEETFIEKFQVASSHLTMKSVVNVSFSQFLAQSNSIRLLSLFTILHSSFNCARRRRNYEGKIPPIVRAVTKKFLFSLFIRVRVTELAIIALKCFLIAK